MLDSSRSFNPADFPRDPSAYSPTSHFKQRFREDRRHLDGEKIQTCFLDGDLVEAEDGCGDFWYNHFGVEYHLIVGWHKDGYRVTVTAWPVLNDRDAALDSGRWTSKQLDTIKSFNERHKQTLEENWPSYYEWSTSNPNGGAVGNP